MSAVPTLSLARLSQSEARAHSIIARHGSGVILQLAASTKEDEESTPSEWKVRIASGISEGVASATTISADIEWSGARLRMALPPCVVSEWLAARLPGLEPGPLPASLAAYAIETLLSEIVASVEKPNQPGSVRVLAVEQTGAPGMLEHGWTLHIQSLRAQAMPFQASLRADGLGLMLLAGLVSKAQPDPDAVDVDPVPVRVAVRLGSTVLTAAELGALALFDTVLMDQYDVDAQGELWLVVANASGIRVRHHDSSFIVTQGWTPLMTETPVVAEESEENVLDIDAITVRLTFDLGERMMTLGELRQLRPGETFDLARPLTEGPVTVRANGAVIGRGELVDVDGRIGVTLHSLGKLST